MYYTSVNRFKMSNNDKSYMAADMEMIDRYVLLCFFY